MGIYLLALYIALIFVRPMEWWPPVLDWQLINIVAWATMIGSFPVVAHSLPLLWRSVPQTKIIAWLLAATVLSYLPVFWVGGMSMAFQEFGKLMILFLLIVALVRSPRDYRLLLWVVAICAAWMAVHGILQTHSASRTGFGGQGAMWRKHLTTTMDGDWDYTWFPQIVAFGIFNDPNDLCLVFVACIPLVWAELRASPNLMTRSVALGIVALFGYGIYLTNSRGGLVGIFGMLAAYAIIRSKGIRRWLLASASILFVTLVMPSRGAQLGTMDIGRLDAWGDGIQAWKAHPLFGVGYRNFEEFSISTKGLAAHNSYITALTELGLLGYIPFFLLIYLTVLHVRRVMLLGPALALPTRFRLAGVFSSLIGYLTSAYFLTRTYNHVLYILLGLALALVTLSCNTSDTYTSVFSNTKKDVRKGILIALASVIFLWVITRLANRLSGR